MSQRHFSQKSLDRLAYSVYTVITVYTSDEFQRRTQLKIILSNRSGEPLYEQIKTQMKDLIYSGELVDGDMLPSVRQLAKDLKISVITTTRAYAELEAEGLVTSVQGKGFYVLPINPQLERENAMSKVEVGLCAAIDAAKLGGISKAEILEALELLMKEEKL
jgi:GntR family transcriptional regulator